MQIKPGGVSVDSAADQLRIASAQWLAARAMERNVGLALCSDHLEFGLSVERRPDGLNFFLQKAIERTTPPTAHAHTAKSRKPGEKYIEWETVRGWSGHLEMKVDDVDEQLSVTVKVHEGSKPKTLYRYKVYPLTKPEHCELCMRRAMEHIMASLATMMVKNWDILLVTARMAGVGEKDA